jgi:membrane-associated phospholipid phosphatase
LLLVGVAIALFVAWSRMYRGMHYVTDAGAGVLMGLAALAVIVFVARATRAAARRRDEERAA